MIFKDFLEAKHGKIDRILLSYDHGRAEYSAVDKDGGDLFHEINKNFHMGIDLMHTQQELTDFKELAPYLNLRVDSWDLFVVDKRIHKNNHHERYPMLIGESVLEVHLSD